MFEELVGRIITKVNLYPFYENEDHYYDKIEFWLGNDVLKIEVNEDTDEIIIQYDQLKKNKNSDLTSDWIMQVEGKKIKGIWIGKNHLGYTDLFVLGLDEGMFPNLCIYSIASQLMVGNINMTE